MFQRFQPSDRETGDEIKIALSAERSKNNYCFRPVHPKIVAIGQQKTAEPHIVRRSATAVDNTG